MKKFIFRLLWPMFACLSISTGFASSSFDIQALLEELKSSSCDWHSMSHQLDEYQKSALSQDEQFDAQLLLLYVLTTIEGEHLDWETWDFELIPRMTNEFCPTIIEKSSTSWQKIFAFFYLAINYAKDGKTRELAIPVLTNAIAQIEHLELMPSTSPILNFLNELYVKDDGVDWYKRAFSGLLGIVYVQLRQPDAADEIRKNIQSPYWQELLGEAIHNCRQVIVAMEGTKLRHNGMYNGSSPPETESPPSPVTHTQPPEKPDPSPSAIVFEIPQPATEPDPSPRHCETPAAAKHPGAHTQWLYAIPLTLIALVGILLFRHKK